MVSLLPWQPQSHVQVKELWKKGKEENLWNFFADKFLISPKNLFCASVYFSIQ